MTLEEKVLALFEEEDLIPSNEIAKLLGVSPAAVSNWKKRHSGFPQPKVKLWNLRLYSKTEVLEWESTREKSALYGGRRIPQTSTMKKLLSRMSDEEKRELKEWL